MFVNLLNYQIKSTIHIVPPPFLTVKSMNTKCFEIRFFLSRCNIILGVYI